MTWALATPLNPLAAPPLRRRRALRSARSLMRRPRAPRAPPPRAEPGPSETDDFVFPGWPPTRADAGRGEARRAGLAVACWPAGPRTRRSGCRELLARASGLDRPRRPRLGYALPAPGDGRGRGARASPPSSTRQPRLRARAGRARAARRAARRRRGGGAAHLRAGGRRSTRQRDRRARRLAERAPPGHGAPRGRGAGGAWPRATPIAAIAEYRPRAGGGPGGGGGPPRAGRPPGRARPARRGGRASWRRIPQATGRCCCAWASSWPGCANTGAPSRSTGACSAGPAGRGGACAGRARCARRWSCSRCRRSTARIPSLAHDHARRPGGADDGAR